MDIAKQIEAFNRAKMILPEAEEVLRNPGIFEAGTFHAEPRMFENIALISKALIHQMRWNEALPAPAEGKLYQPTDTKLLVWGTAGIRFGLYDNVGQWRTWPSNKPLDATKYWKPVPLSPAEMAES